MKRTIAYLKRQFETGDRPTENDYIDLFDTLSNEPKVVSFDLNDISRSDTFVILDSDNSPTAINQMIALEHLFIDVVLDSPYSQTTTVTTLSFFLGGKNIGSITVNTNTPQQEVIDFFKTVPQITPYVRNANSLHSDFTMKFADDRTGGNLKIKLHVKYSTIELQKEPVAQPT